MKRNSWPNPKGVAAFVVTTYNYDTTGNTTGSGEVSYGYDFENHMTSRGTTDVVYDGDGTVAAGTSTTFTANGVGSLTFWSDFSDPTDPVFGSVQLIPLGGQAAAEPSYEMSYFISDGNGTFNDAGQGFIPASAVSVSGDSIVKGNAVIKLNVDTCTLPPNEFVTSGGPCGTVQVTATEIPGFTYTVNGTTTITIGPSREVFSGTTQNANALASGNVVGFEFSSAELVFINQFSGVTVTLSRQ